MTASLSPIVKQQFFDDSGNPLASGKLYTYIAGSNTPVATYKTAAGNDENTNPIILNARGECDIWLSSSIAYKFKLCDSDNAEIWTVDNITVGGTGGSGGTVDWSSITNRPTTFPPSPHTQNWTTILNTPTTLGGYGITNAYTKAEIDTYLGELFQRVINLEYYTQGQEIRITSLESSVSAINNDITNLQNTDISLQTQIDGNTSAINSLQESVNDIFEDINVINANVNTLSGDITSLLDSQYKVKTTSGDTNPGYLSTKIVSGNEAIAIAESAGTMRVSGTGKIPSDASDTVTSAWGTLFDKLVAGANTTLDVVTCAGTRKVQINAITSGIAPVLGDHKVMASLSDPSYGTLEEKLINVDGSTFSVVTCGGVQKVQIAADTYKTKVTSATSASYLNDVIAAGTGIEKIVSGNQLVIYSPNSTKVSVNSADTNPGYLADKIKGSDNISITTSANQVLIVSATGEFDTYKVKTDGSDIADYLPNKLMAAGAVDIQTVALGPSEKKTMIIGTGKVATTSSDTSPDFLNNKLVAGDGISITTSGDVMTVATNFSSGVGCIAETNFATGQLSSAGYFDIFTPVTGPEFVNGQIISGFPSGFVQFNFNAPIYANQSSATTTPISAFRGYSPNPLYPAGYEQVPVIYADWANSGFGGTTNSRFTFSGTGKWQINWGAQMFTPAGSHGTVDVILRHYSNINFLKATYNAAEATGFWTTSGITHPIDYGAARRSEVLEIDAGDYIELRVNVAGQAYGSTVGATSAYQIDYSGHLIENSVTTQSTRTVSIAIEKHSLTLPIEPEYFRWTSNDDVDNISLSTIFKNDVGDYYKIGYVISPDVFINTGRLSIASLIGAKGDRGEKGDTGDIGNTSGVGNIVVQTTSAGTLITTTPDLSATYTSYVNGSLSAAPIGSITYDSISDRFIITTVG